MSTADRIARIMKERGLLQREAAAVMGITRQAFGRYLKGASTPDKDKIQKLAAFLNVSASYLMFGENESEFETSNGETVCIQIDSCDTAESIRMLRVNKQWLAYKALNSNLSNLRLMNITSDNMAPTINKGDVIIIDTSVTTIQSEGIYFVEANDQKFVKRAQRKMNGSLLLIDDNSRYSHSTLSLEEQAKLNVIGKCLIAFQAKEL